MTASGQLSLEDNIFLAKRNLVDSIWKEARLEGIGATYPQTADVERPVIGKVNER